MRIATAIFLLLFVFSMQLSICLSNLRVHVTISVPRKEIVCFSIVVDNASEFDTLSTWLDDLNYSKFTFALWESEEDEILNNATRIAKLEEYGDIIPRRGYIQTKTPQQRKDTIDSMIAEYNSSLGYVPNGLHDFIPDTYTCQYLLSKGFSYVQGYCLDQWAIDYMSQMGGWQLPYFADPLHVLRPSSQPSGIVVLPHNTWDWIDGLTVHLSVNSHVQNLMAHIFVGDNASAKDYWLKLMDYTLAGCDPLGYFCMQFEFDWVQKQGYADEAKDWISAVMENRTYDLMTFNETANWLSQNYKYTPVYTVDFQSPYSGERIEWYHDNKSRVARVGNKVVSYVDYTDQCADKYITEKKDIDWGLPHTLDLNCIDNSLMFTIDALGGGTWRHDPKTEAVTYSGRLSHFGQWYATSHSGGFPTAIAGVIAGLTCLFVCVGIIRRRKNVLVPGPAHVHRRDCLGLRARIRCDSRRHAYMRASIQCMNVNMFSQRIDET